MVSLRENDSGLCPCIVQPGPSGLGCCGRTCARDGAGFQIAVSCPPCVVLPARERGSLSKQVLRTSQLGDLSQVVIQEGETHPRWHSPAPAARYRCLPQRVPLLHPAPIPQPSPAPKGPSDCSCRAHMVPQTPRPAQLFPASQMLENPLKHPPSIHSQSGNGHSRLKGAWLLYQSVTLSQQIFEVPFPEFLVLGIRLFGL